MSHSQSHRGSSPEEPGKQGTRMCVGCRERSAREALMRLTLVGEPPTLLPDVRRRESGRGVSVHPRRSCLRQAVKRGAFRRAFRREVTADAEQLAQWASAQYARRVEGLLLGAKRAGLAVLGAEAARAAMRQRKVQLLLVARDAAAGRAEIERSAEKLGQGCLVYGDRDGLGKLFGRQELAVIAVLDAAIARELRSAAQGASELAEAS